MMESAKNKRLTDVSAIAGFMAIWDMTKVFFRINFYWNKSKEVRDFFLYFSAQKVYLVTTRLGLR